MADVWLSTEALRILLPNKKGGFGVDERTIRTHITEKKYTDREVQGGRGGKGGVRYEVLLSSLPKEAQEKYWADKTQGTMEGIKGELAGCIEEENKALSPSPSPSGGGEKKQAVARPQQPKAPPNSRQRIIARARAGIVKPLCEGEASLTKGINAFIAQLLAGQFDERQWLACAIANDRNGFAWEVGLEDGRMTAIPARGQDVQAFAQKLSARSLYRWSADYKAKGIDGLIPGKAQADRSVKIWHGMALTLRKRPQGACLRWLQEELAKHWHSLGLAEEAPSYDQIRRYFADECSQLEQLKGRHTRSQLWAKTYYKRRTADGMMPWDEVHADGWNTHFTAPHPVTGEFVTYEVWHAHDVATRYVPPYAVGLTENAEVIAKCLENIIREGGVPIFWQTDSTNIVKEAPRFQSIADRAGFSIVHPVTVGKSQTNGIAENYNTSVLDDQAKQLATYQHEDMDTWTFKLVKKLTAKMVKAAKDGDLVLRDKLKRQIEQAGKGYVFTSYQDALDWLESGRVEFNNRPHSSLPKLRCPATGRMRNYSPLEYLEKFKAEGWEPVLLDERELSDLFRPHVKCKVVRGLVTPYKGMKFRSAELDHWLGKEVIVAYDIMDYTQVWVKTLAGEDICTAKFDEAVGYRAKTAYEVGEERRALGQIKRLEKKITTVEERNPGLLLEQSTLSPGPSPLGRGEASVIELKDFRQVFEDAALPEPEEPEQEKTLLDVLGDEKPREGETGSYSETVMWLFGNADEDEEEDEEAAQ